MWRTKPPLGSAAFGQCGEGVKDQLWGFANEVESHQNDTRLLDRWIRWKMMGPVSIV
jgi:hypothetical protein